MSSRSCLNWRWANRYRCSRAERRNLNATTTGEAGGGRGVLGGAVANVMNASSNVICYNTLKRLSIPLISDGQTVVWWNFASAVLIQILRIFPFYITGVLNAKVVLLFEQILKLSNFRTIYQWYRRAVTTSLFIQLFDFNSCSQYVLSSFLHSSSSCHRHHHTRSTRAIFHVLCHISSLSCFFKETPIYIIMCSRL